MSKVLWLISFLGFVICLTVLSACGGGSPSFGPTLFPSVSDEKDISDFRDNIANGYLPFPTDITYGGLFHDYFFNTGIDTPCDKLFCPSYASAISKDPFSEKEEYYLAVGLNSQIENLPRKKWNIVLVLDISSTMASHFSEYDENGEAQSAEDLSKTKLQAAATAIVALLESKQLKPEDNIGIVLFHHSAVPAKLLGAVKHANLKSIKTGIASLRPNGGTNMFAGMAEATKLFRRYFKNQQSKIDEFENRIIFLTDAQPSIGAIEELKDQTWTGNDLFDLITENASRKIYTSFIGIGVDFDPKLVEALGKVHGANHHSVHSPSQFTELINEEFSLMVTPLVFDLNLTVKSDGFNIKKVYGSSQADETTGQVIQTATFFPSKKAEEETRGGVVLLHLERVPEAQDHTIQLTSSYKTREGEEDSSSISFEFNQETEFYDNNGIRKALLLTRYVSFLRNWLVYERSDQKNLTTVAEDGSEQPILPETIYNSEGIFLLPEGTYHLSQWERKPVELLVSEGYVKLFEKFTNYFKAEMEAIGDSSLEKELGVLNTLVALNSTEAGEADTEGTGKPGVSPDPNIAGDITPEAKASATE